MLTNRSTTSSAAQPGQSPERVTAPARTQKVMIVNGNAEVLNLFETVLEAGHYDVVFVESSEHAYSQIKRVQPNLVILCMRLEDPNGFQILSMLKLDQETCAIPVLTYTGEFDSQQEEDDEAAEPSGAGIFGPEPALRMN